MTDPHFTDILDKWRDLVGVVNADPDGLESPTLAAIGVADVILRNWSAPERMVSDGEGGISIEWHGRRVQIEPSGEAELLIFEGVMLRVRHPLQVRKDGELP